MSIRVRSAPSPTGHLHVGAARSALFNYLFAKKNGGSYILRVEDTDKERSKKEYESTIFEALDWLGITPDEGPMQGGEFGPYRQSERGGIYHDAVERLLNSGQAFYCDHAAGPEEEYAAHWCAYRDAAQSRNAGIIRFKTPRGGAVVFHDIIRGKIRTASDEIGDFSIAKNPELPLYNLAAAVDDSHMRISHVLRGEEHIANTPKQILILEALGLPLPQYAHLPLVLGPDRSKLSKRHGATSVLEFKKAGYLPEALVNFIALLGWNPGTDQEIFSLEELGREFSLEKVQKSGAIFDTVKLDWMNGEYIRRKPLPVLVELLKPFLQKSGLFQTADHESRITSEYVEKIAALEQPRLKTLSEIGDKARYFFRQPQYEKELLRWKDMNDEDITASLQTSEKVIFHFPYSISKLEIEKKFLEAIGESDKGRVLWPLRIALTGLKASPGPFDVIAILGKEESLARIQLAISKLQ